MPHRTRFGIPAVIVVVALTVSDASAIPAFARKYNVPCVTCHTGDFKLNAFGNAVDLNGFQLPGMIERTPIWHQSTIPISILLQERASRTSTSFQNSKEPDSNNSTINTLAMSIVAGGVIAPHVSVMSEIDFELNGQELLSSLEYAFANFNNIFCTDRGQMNIRFGKMRMETQFEQTPEFYRSKYLIYEYPVMVSSRPQQFYLSHAWYSVSGNAELSFLPTAPQLTVAYALGDLGDIATSSVRMAYSRLSTDIMVDNIPVTLGVSGIYGEQTIDPTSPRDSIWNIGRHFGVDLLISQPNGGPFSVYGSLMRFTSTDVLTAPGNQPQNALGGFVELNAVVIPEKITTQLRFDFVNRETIQAGAPTDPAVTRFTNIAQYTLLARYFILPNVHLFVEGNLQSTQTYLSNAQTSSLQNRSALFLSGGFFFGI